MKFRQHIRVYGYPDILKQVIPTKRPATIEVDGVGKINLVSIDKAKKMKKLLEEHQIKYTNVAKSDTVRVRYLLLNHGFDRAIRGKKWRGDILYTIEANDERELLDKRDAALQELKTLKVKYEDVCKWVCESAPKLNTKKVIKRKVMYSDGSTWVEYDTPKKLEAKIEGIQQELAELKEKPIKKAMVDDRKTMKGVLS